MKKTHIGGKLDDFLQEDRLLEAATATKRVIAHQIALEMKRPICDHRHLGEGRSRPEPAAHGTVALRFAGD